MASHAHDQHMAVIMSRGIMQIISAHDMLNFFKGYPAYREIEEIMEQHWEHETIMKLYQ